MLREMEPEEYQKWKTFAGLEPFGEERADMRTASVEQALYNLHRNRETNPKPWPLIDFLLGFGDMPRATPVEVTQSIETMELHLDVWCTTQNLLHAAKMTKGT